MPRIPVRRGPDVTPGEMAARIAELERENAEFAAVVQAVYEKAQDDLRRELGLPVHAVKRKRHLRSLGLAGPVVLTARKWLPGRHLAVALTAAAAAAGTGVAILAGPGSPSRASAGPPAATVRAAATSRHGLTATPPAARPPARSRPAAAGPVPVAAAATRPSPSPAPAAPSLPGLLPSLPGLPGLASASPTAVQPADELLRLIHEVRLGEIKETGVGHGVG